MSIKLICRGGSLAGRSFEFDVPVIPVGRDHNNLVRFDPYQDNRVSGNHCEIYEKEGQYYLRDKDSLNHTSVDDQTVKEPVRLRDGSVIQLGGEKGPRIEVQIQHEDGRHPTLANTVRGGASTPSPSGRSPAADEAAGPKQGVGIVTLVGKLEQAKEEVREEQSRKTKLIAAALGVVLCLALGASFLVWKKSGEKTGEVAGEVAKVRKEVKKMWGFAGALDVRLAANEKEMRGRIASLGVLIARKERAITDLGIKLESASKTGAGERERIEKRIQVARSDLGEMRANLEAYQAENRGLFEKAMAPFKAVAKNYENSVYGVFYRKKTKASGAFHYTFIGTSFAINPTLGLLGTNGHITEPVKALLASGSGEVVVRCSGSPRHLYRVVKAVSHSDYVLAAKSRRAVHRSPDVGILQVDLHTSGQAVAMPGYLHPASPEELDALAAGTPVGLLGFPGEYHAQYENPDGSTLVAKLVPGIVSATLSFAGSPLSGRTFEFMEHTCHSTPGNSGSPIFNTAGNVVALLNSGEHAMVGILDRKAKKMKLTRLAIGPVKYAVNVRFLRNLVRLHYGAGQWE